MAGVPVAADLKNTPCAPNDYFKIDCNTCYCNIDKTGYLCTENLCPITEPPATETPNSTVLALNSTTPVAEAVPQSETISLNETAAVVIESNNDTNLEPLIVTNLNNNSDTGGGTSKILNGTHL